MSEAPEQETISIVEINGRIGELEAQRDAALARAVKIAGEKAEALDLVRILKAENDRLTALLNDRGDPAPAAPANDPETSLAPAGAAATAH
ncbi:hypothetical protein FHR71_002160 [Methylobacterium sp. RAS18]|nr:hypothetical protein [Methylobacterium sp. RAS18]